MFFCSTGETQYAFRFYRTKPFRKQPRMTFCVVLRKGATDAATTLLYGRSKCSKKDQFNKEAGRKLALERAIAPLPRTDRALIWSVYHGRTNPLIAAQISEALKENRQLVELISRGNRV
jgi:hypothetical protein